jgi:trans-aconitate 2-methyltransferase
MTSAKYVRFFENWSAPQYYAGTDETSERLRNAGFINVETWSEAAAFALPDANTFKEYVAKVTLHRHLARISDPESKEEFLSELARQASGDDPPFHMDYWRLNIKAKKRFNL